MMEESLKLEVMVQAIIKKLMTLTDEQIAELYELAINDKQRNKSNSIKER